MAFRCKKQCFFDNRMYQEGDLYFGVKANKHFEEISEKEGEETLESQTMPAMIKSALLALDHGDDSIWTKVDTVKVKVIEQMTGLSSLTKDDIEAAFPGFKRDVKPLTRSVKAKPSYID